jgi:hypothetical protein
MWKPPAGRESAWHVSTTRAAKSPRQSMIGTQLEAGLAADKASDAISGRQTNPNMTSLRAENRIAFVSAQLFTPQRGHFPSDGLNR